MKQNEWTPWLKNEFAQPYFRDLAAFVHEEYEKGTVYPPKVQVFSAFENVDYPDIRVVILGQDPYHQPHQAHGMCFSVNPGVPVPPSLRNIFQELHDDVGFRIPDNGYLMPWAHPGVFLLNTLTSRCPTKARGGKHLPTTRSAISMKWTRRLSFCSGAAMPDRNRG